MKKKILIALSIVICVVAIGVFVLAGRGYSPSVGRFLRTENGSMIIIDNSPIVMSVRNGNENAFEKYENGDKILVIHDGILESYPAQTGVYFSIKLSDGHISHISEGVLKQLSDLGWKYLPVKADEQGSEESSVTDTENLYAAELFDINTVRSHSVFDSDKISLLADNAEFAEDEEIYHFSVFAFHTYESYREFIDNFDKTFDSGYSNADEFRKGLEYLNEEYFNDHSVILVPYWSGAGNVSYKITSIYADDDICRLNIEEHKSGNVGTAAITSFITAVGIEKSFLGDCGSFDAVLVE